jgi:cytochrome c oxidase cbb3-type subunit 4
MHEATQGTLSGTLLGMTTVFFLAVFLGAFFWAYSGRRKADFDTAARIPLDEE